MIDSIDRNGGKYGKHPDGDISSTRMEISGETMPEQELIDT